ncbi:MAG: hypothetical protein ACYDER_04605 [Ktedonobacteraceae bacterium]
MSMSDSSFEFILQALRMQKQCLEQLQAENSELHQQLADLRNGQGIFVEILGARCALVGTQPLEVLAHATTQEAPTLELTLVQTVDTPTMPFIPETPRPVEPVEEYMPLQEQVTEEITPAFSSSLLEDEMNAIDGMDEDEFADLVTSPIAVWKGAEANPQPKNINEDEKAALRRELIGSFLLE